jgi:hypothetical protein
MKESTLKLCDVCMQMTNHKGNVCQKHTREDEFEHLKSTPRYQKQMTDDQYNEKCQVPDCPYSHNKDGSPIITN